MNDEKFWESYFGKMNDTYRWLESAAKLKFSADILFAAHLKSCELSDEERAESQDEKVDGVATLLYGLATENLIKATLLKKGIAKVQTDGRVMWNAEGANGHDLLAMCQSIKFIKLNNEQEKLLERMSAFVLWAGKYPTPWGFKDVKTKKDFRGLLLTNQPGAAQIMLPVQMSARDKIVFEQIYTILSKAFN